MDGFYKCHMVTCWCSFREQGIMTHYQIAELMYQASMFFKIILSLVKQSAVNIKNNEPNISQKEHHVAIWHSLRI